MKHAQICQVVEDLALRLTFELADHSSSSIDQAYPLFATSIITPRNTRNEDFQVHQPYLALPRKSA